jgi:hypothetical protein
MILTRLELIISKKVKDFITLSNGDTGKNESVD